MQSAASNRPGHERTTIKILYFPGNRMVTPGRLELPTNGLGNRCSIHLSYGATKVEFTLAGSGFS